MVSAEDVRKNRLKRIICEALLLDPSTPVLLFTDLLGINEIELEKYKQMYFLDWKLNRLELLLSIQSIEDDVERELKENVFFHGWETVSAVYAQGKYIDSTETVDKIIKTLIGRLMFIMSESKITKNTVQMLKDVVKMLKDIKEDDVSGSNDEWEFIFQSVDNQEEE